MRRGRPNHLWSCSNFYLTFLTFPADKWTKFALSFWPTAYPCLFGWATHPVYMSHVITHDVNMMSLMSEYANVLHKCHVAFANQTHMMQETHRYSWRELFTSSFTKTYCMTSLPHYKADQIMYELQSSKNKVYVRVRGMHAIVHVASHKDIFFFFSWFLIL